MSVESDRLIDLESRLAFQEDALERLNDVIVAQRDRLDRLQRGYELLLQRVQEFQTAETSGVEIPPHY